MLMYFIFWCKIPVIMHRLWTYLVGDSCKSRAEWVSAKSVKGWPASFPARAQLPTWFVCHIGYHSTWLLSKQSRKRYTIFDISYIVCFYILFMYCKYWHWTWKHVELLLKSLLGLFTHIFKPTYGCLKKPVAIIRHWQKFEHDLSNWHTWKTCFNGTAWFYFGPRCFKYIIHKFYFS